MTEIVTEDFVIEEFVLLYEVPLVELLDVFCNDVVLDFVITVKDELLVVTVGGVCDVELFAVAVPFELCDGESAEKAYWGKIKRTRNENKSR